MAQFMLYFLITGHVFKINKDLTMKRFTFDKNWVIIKAGTFLLYGSKLAGRNTLSNLQFW
jgi:hypothetical protein